MLDASLWRRALLVAIIPWALACSDDDDDDTGSQSGPTTTSDGGSRDTDASAAHHPESAAGTDNLAPLPEDEALPIVFVHGFAGSAQQFQSQAMRYVMNGYPAERLRAYEHNGAGAAGDDFVSGLDAVVDEVRAKYSTDKVYLIGHSRGTAVSTMYLSDEGRAAKVAKYASLDGGGCGDMIPVPCVSPAQTTNTRGVQTDPLEGQRHVEVATSKESFAVQFKFLFGREPKVIDIVKQKEPVVISGRAVNFPANTGRDGVKLDFWELDDAGKRVGSKPKATYELGSDGNWGPLTVDPTKHYEQVLISSDSANQHHFFSQPFLRSTEFVRLLSGPPDSDSRVHTNAGEHHAALVLMRMREWTTDDKVDVSTESESGDQDAKNVITADITKNPISLFLHDDAATPEDSSLALLPWFNDQPFQSGVDIFMPANETPDGTITLTSSPRGATDRKQTLRVPNWASSKHTITVMFNDFPQD